MQQNSIRSTFLALMVLTASLVVGVGSAAALSFAAHSDFATGARPTAVASGDLNADGSLDLVTANYNDSTVSVLLGDGHGGFGLKTDFATAASPYRIVLGDLNCDGKPDLVTSNGGAGSVSILLGNGDGTFAARTDIATGSGSVTVGDFNGDAKPDLAKINGGANTVSIFLGNGDGSFAVKTDYGTGAGPGEIVLGDFNGDAKQDLAIDNFNNAANGSVSILLGNGDGTFAAKTDFAVGDSTYAIVAGDFNADGRQDLAMATGDSNVVTCLLGNGTGGFGAKAVFAAGDGPYAISSGDLNGDGRLDLVAADENSGANNVNVLLNTSLPRPRITGLSSASAKRGATITITGTGFGASRGPGFVKFGTTKSTQYLSWSKTRIRCRVPANAAFGGLLIRVTTKGGVSAGKSFRVKR